MKATDIQSLLDFISKAGLDEVSIETENLKLSVKRYSQISSVAQTNVVASNFVATPQLPQVSTPVVSSTEKIEAPKEVKLDTSNLLTIKSPMIGTFYRTATPDSPPFVNIGDDVKIGQVVCIIEAMKLFNEIESEISGKIVKILVENATPVEYDQPLFLVEPK
ncbi:MAG: acetyl-CoA carboxylase biotin carboxyl carrier protein [Cytophagia bacterium]|nr:MAG: acetyl-CoA carboxylase biotin carboxyl carrier protein [Cytophagia bacterium]TAG38991.1 MAG: acetyl-CoA carboxylase biotin carboxyl carrier protein [Cytophagia bacterium]TAH30501.1 MAG: acetyl-CoA carboxylase biotin carboxyl carrier protein [Cytophagales bacterium]